MTGVTHELSFEPKNDKGNNKGDYELFLDLQSGDTVVFTPPINWMFAGVKVYAATESGGAGKPVQTPQAKTNDIASLRQGNFSQVFDNWADNLPEGFAAVDLQSAFQGSLKYTGTTTGFYEYLIWITSDDQGDDFVDPGLRNRGTGGSN